MQVSFERSKERIFTIMNAPIIAVAFVLSLLTGISKEKQQDKPQEKSSCPMHEQHKTSQGDQHHQGVVVRGDQVMGFSHEKTAHHFRLYADGGAIEAEANDAQDTASRDAIRAHLGHIATMFAAGGVSPPQVLHEQKPPGAGEMKRRCDGVQYNLEET